ncbi:hypothetical protein [Thalassotalea agarivorans]|uniref:Uncharacterized protein n=1 Tax=Thalassotalea agarivorans TaxID=349064 RepID=A0A1I0EBF5_THASX|nr:hypothetical protein [Thalassotalea agarivorans]SET42588.1 hypothetical protein SAMN05660429_01809 [Thalassotalea agarivorans]
MSFNLSTIVVKQYSNGLFAHIVVGFSFIAFGVFSVVHGFVTDDTISANIKSEIMGLAIAFFFYCGFLRRFLDVKKHFLSILEPTHKVMRALFIIGGIGMLVSLLLHSIFGALTIGFIIKSLFWSGENIDIWITSTLLGSMMFFPSFLLIEISRKTSVNKRKQLQAS